MLALVYIEDLFFVYILFMSFSFYMLFIIINNKIIGLLLFL